MRTYERPLKAEFGFSVALGPGPQEHGNFSFSATVSRAMNRRERTALPATRSSLLMDPEPFGRNVQCCLGLAAEFAWRLGSRMTLQRQLGTHLLLMVLFQSSVSLSHCVGRPPLTAVIESNLARVLRKIKFFEKQRRCCWVKDWDPILQTCKDLSWGTWRMQRWREHDGC